MASVFRPCARPPRRLPPSAHSLHRQHPPRPAPHGAAPTGGPHLFSLTVWRQLPHRTSPPTGGPGGPLRSPLLPFGSHTHPGLPSLPTARPRRIGTCSSLCLGLLHPPGQPRRWRTTDDPRVISPRAPADTTLKSGACIPAQRTTRGIAACAGCVHYVACPHVAWVA